MEENEKIGAQLVNCAQLLRAARKGMRKKDLAARIGMTLRQFEAVISVTPKLEIAIAQAYADHDEEQRDGLARVLGEAIESKELSLQAKILRENQKEANEREREEREEREERMAKAVESFAGFELLEPEYGTMSDERKAEIAAQVEAMEAMRAEMGSAEDAEDE